MFLDINKIGRDGLDLDRQLDLGDLEGTAGESVPVHAARLRGNMVRGERGVNFTGHLEASVQLSCGRCLRSFDAPIATDFFLTLVYAAAEFGVGETQVKSDDAELFYAPEGKADLRAIATEQVYLNLPLKPVCREDCRGLCPSCGADLNSGECGCRSEDVDPRLAPLLRWKQGPES